MYQLNRATVGYMAGSRGHVIRFIHSVALANRAINCSRSGGKGRLF